MCGIVGVVNAKSVTKDDVWKMIDCIKYRGVDEQGVEQLGRALLGHARLVLDAPPLPVQLLLALVLRRVDMGIGARIFGQLLAGRLSGTVGRRGRMR